MKLKRKIMEIVFLKDGTEANLITKTEQGYIVDPIITYQDDEGEEYSQPLGSVRVVSEVFKTAPVEKVQAECKEWRDRTDTLRVEFQEMTHLYYKMQNDLNAFKSTKTNLERFIINKQELQNAKRLVMWAENSIAPRIIDGTEGRKFQISFNMSRYAGEESIYSYALYNQSSRDEWASGDRCDTKYGILVDPTDEEVLRITQERVDRIASHLLNWAISSADDKWLTPELIVKKKEIAERCKQDELKAATKRLEQAQKEIDTILKK